MRVRFREPDVTIVTFWLNVYLTQDVRESCLAPKPQALVFGLESALKSMLSAVTLGR